MAVHAGVTEPGATVPMPATYDVSHVNERTRWSWQVLRLLEDAKNGLPLQGPVQLAAHSPSAGGHHPHHLPSAFSTSTVSKSAVQAPPGRAQHDVAVKCPVKMQLAARTRCLSAALRTEPASSMLSRGCCAAAPVTTEAALPKVTHIPKKEPQQHAAQPGDARSPTVPPRSVLAVRTCWLQAQAASQAHKLGLQHASTPAAHHAMHLLHSLTQDPSQSFHAALYHLKMRAVPELQRCPCFPEP